MSFFDTIYSFAVDTWLGRYFLATYLLAIAFKLAQTIFFKRPDNGNTQVMDEPHVYVVGEKHSFHLNPRTGSYQLHRKKDFGAHPPEITQMSPCPVRRAKVVSCTLIHKNRLQYILQNQNKEYVTVWFYVNPQDKRMFNTWKVSDIVTQFHEELRMDLPEPGPVVEQIRTRVDITPMYSKQPKVFTALDEIPDPTGRKQ